MSNVVTVDSYEDPFIDFKSTMKIMLLQHGKAYLVIILEATRPDYSALHTPSFSGVECNCTSEKVIIRDMSAQPTTEVANIYLDCGM